MEPFNQKCGDLKASNGEWENHYTTIRKDTS